MRSTVLEPVQFALPPPSRAEDFAVKQRRAREFMQDQNVDALLLTTPAAFSWYTSGGENLWGCTGQTCAAVVITRDQNWVLAEPSQLERIRCEQIPGLPLELLPAARYSPWEVEARKLIGRKKCGSDVHLEDCEAMVGRLARLRVDLTPLELSRYRELGKILSNQVEGVSRSVEPGQREADLAGLLAQRLLKLGVQPVELNIVADDRANQFGSASFHDAAVQQRCWVAATGRYFGLHASTGRAICFGQSNRHFIRDYRRTSMISAACIYYSRAGMKTAELIHKVQRCYDQVQRGDEFSRVEPGWITGHARYTWPLFTSSPYRLCPSTALIWQPIVGGAPSCDTILVDETGYETLTCLVKWPVMQIEINSHQIERPDLLIRE